MDVSKEPTTESIEHLDWSLKCLVRFEDYFAGVLFRRQSACGLDVTWSVTCHVCGRSGYMCDRHTIQVKCTPLIGCACGSSGAGNALFDFIPLGGV